jgi:hypothetical protein
LLEATDNWAFNIDKGNVNAVVFLNLKKVFDTVDHSILLSKLKAYGVGNASYDFFKSYLDNRKQKCFVNGSLSESQSLSCGIPQGTILGRDICTRFYRVICTQLRVKLDNKAIWLTICCSVEAEDL